ncbi:hypothetical protein [Microbacterium maritypicum]|uniref:hypothetical protein n=1 Tax=Microbacterium maritypicum TaxID=33918 RepID=UPI003812FAB9
MATTRLSDLTTEIEKALTDEAYDGGSGPLSEVQFSRYVRRLAETAVEVIGESKAKADAHLQDLLAKWDAPSRPEGWNAGDEHHLAAQIITALRPALRLTVLEFTESVLEIELLPWQRDYLSRAVRDV